MPPVSTALDKLKHELQNEQDSAKLEHLAAALLGRLLNVPIAVARSGFQHGADAGPAGQQGRRFRVECKRYRDTTYLDERELLGEVEHALARDEALEAWVLVTTRTVPEQIRQSLDQHGIERGVPIVIIDWTDHEIAPLAALCASSPDLLEELFSTTAGEAARLVHPEAGDAIERLKHDLESWCLGFESLRQKSHARLNKIWNSPRESNSVLGLDAAGGSREKRIKRKTVHKALNEWWREPSHSDSPAAVIGWEGTGKTWATLNWLIDSKSDQPIVLIVPSSGVDRKSGFSESNLKRLLGDCLCEVSGVRDSEHWFRRLDYLLQRPVDEGPVLTIVFDGLNQEPSVSWLTLLKVLQGDAFEGRIRVVVSTRKHHFENKLSKLNGLIAPAVPIEVGRYDTLEGGELDQMLKHHNLVRDDLYPDVLEMALTPRLFELVVRFREKLAGPGQLTVHRLLWEYGRDSVGARAEKSFSEGEWKDWLKTIARKYRLEIPYFSTTSLGRTVSRPDLTPSEVYARLSDIIDGKFAKQRESGDLELVPAVVAHALGLTLLDHLNQVTPLTFENLDEKLKEWLDPIAGFDQPAEIIRAAVSILLDQGRATSLVLGVLITTWLQAQNVPDAHRNEIVELAPNFPEALLDAVEHSGSSTHDSARYWAVKALRAISREDFAALEIIIKRTQRWLGTIYRNINTRKSANKDHNKWRLDQLRKRIGTNNLGQVTVVGVELELVDQSLDLVKATVPSILEGFPLSKTLPTFEVAAASRAATDQVEVWDGLKWLCLLNKIDPDKTAMELRNLSENVRRRQLEQGVPSDFPKRMAAHLLWLTGQERDDTTGNSIHPRLNDRYDYENGYLSDPSKSWLPIERRHAQIALEDTEISLKFRTQRIGDLWLDPNFEAPDSFLAELREAAVNIDVDKLNQAGGWIIEEHKFEVLEPVLARYTPDILADLIRRKMKSVATCPQESRYRNAMHATDHLVLAGEAERAASRKLRLSGCHDDEIQESHAANQLLLMEICNLDGRNQVEALIEADLRYISEDFVEVLRPLKPKEADRLIDHYKTGSQKQQKDLLCLMSIQTVQLTDRAWSWVEAIAKQGTKDLAKLAFKILTRTDSARFGRTLLIDGWSWSPAKHIWVNHYGTDALIEATFSQSFDELAPRLASWRLLRAVRRRGADPAEVRLAAEIFGIALTGNEMKEPDLGSDVSIDLAKDKGLPFSYSVTPRQSEDELQNLKLAFDPNTRVKAYRRSIETSATRTCEARRSGAHLFQAILDKRDFEPILQHASEHVEQWLEGCSRPTAEFQRRVRLADGAFLGLCEALLIHDPEQGSRLWRALRETMTTRYIGAAGVDDLLHMVFRVPDSPAVAKLKYEIAEMKYGHTNDLALFDIAIAASYNGEIEWLRKFIEEDRESPFVWRQARAKVLEGFSAKHTLPIESAWPDSELKTNNSRLICKSARSQWTEACARHWWQIYLKASNPTEAYAAWVLFLRSADRRNWVWMQEDIDAIKESNDFFDLKMAHFHLNRKNLERAMKKREEKFDHNFLYRRVSKGIGPWT